MAKQDGLGRADALLARLLKARDDIHARIALVQNEREEQVLARLREAGAGQLPPEALEKLIENIRAAVQVQTTASIDEADTKQDCVKVKVRLSRNAGEQKQGALRAAGLVWNGKQGRYIGRVSKARLAKLIEQFGDRVEVEAAEEAPTDGASPSTAVPSIEAPSVVTEPAVAPVPMVEADQAPAVAPSIAAPAAEPSPASEPAAPRDGFLQPSKAPLPRLPPLRRPSAT